MRALSVLALITLVAACAASDDKGGVSDENLDAPVTMPRLPQEGGTGELTAWGGADSSRWRPEAIVANAASRALNDGWSRPRIADVVVAIPTRVTASNFFEFGDGQANARVDFVDWHAAHPPVVASVLRFQGAPTKLLLRFDRALPYSGNAFELRFGANTVVPLNATRDEAGDAVVEISLPSGLSWDGLLSEQAALVHPAGWADWFPLFFQTGVKNIRDLRVAESRFSDGRSIIDRESVTSAGASDGRSVLERLQAHRFGGSYNGTAGQPTPFTPPSIHATFPLYPGKNLTTGVGRGWTWVADEKPAGFKVMYTCFERRRADLESSAPDGGVASGGGWHQINDAAETIVNDLENAPAVVAYARNNPWLPSKLPSGALSYGLTDVTTYRWLRPGEAFITTKGSVVDDGAGHSFEQSNYHWYFFQQSHDVCTEEIVNPPGQIPQGFDL